MKTAYKHKQVSMDDDFIKIPQRANYFITHNKECELISIC